MGIKNFKQKIILVSNTKGGTGKSTLSVHMSICLEYLGYKTCLIDTDANQGSSFNYLNNRVRFSKSTGINMPTPIFKAINNDENNKEDFHLVLKKLEEALDEAKNCHIIIIDSPGYDGFLTRQLIKYASLILSPINESLIDISALFWSRFDQEKNVYIPSTYTELIWDFRKRSMLEKKIVPWVLVLNRMSNVFTRNKENVQLNLKKFSKLLGFHLEEGLFERTIFKEMFESGRTVLDLIYGEDNSDYSRYVTSGEEIMYLTKRILDKL